MTQCVLQRRNSANNCVNSMCVQAKTQQGLFKKIYKRRWFLLTEDGVMVCITKQKQSTMMKQKAEKQHNTPVKAVCAC